MKTRVSLLALLFALFPSLAIPQSQPAPQPITAVVVKAGKLLDVRKGAYIEGAAIWIEGDRIKEVGTLAEVQSHAPKNAQLIDLSHATVLPGLIDCHTHLMARFADDMPNDYILGLATKSQAFRALEGAADARVTLLAGFTTVRDVENEGSGYADVALRDAIVQALVEGPRMEVATRGIAAVGQYNPFGVSPDLTDFPTGAQMVSGVEDARRAVREQIGHGADLIKVYADSMWPAWCTFTQMLRLPVRAAGILLTRYDTASGLSTSLTRLRNHICTTALFTTSGQSPSGKWGAWTARSTLRIRQWN